MGRDFPVSILAAKTYRIFLIHIS